MGSFKKGDRVIFKRARTIEIEIVKTIDKSYLWKYPNQPDSERNLFDSRNTTDPELEFWELKKSK